VSQKIIIESLAMDLKRVALGLHRGSNLMANRFKIEALKREDELEHQELTEYLRQLLQKTKEVLNSKDNQAAEDALMYSTLFQNYSLKKYK